MLMAEKVDRRVRKTKAQLRAGLARLMQKKSIKEITVKELVDEVDINRSTFYLHYSDIYQMLESIETELMDEIAQVIEEHPLDLVQNGSSYPMIEHIFTILDNNKDICIALMGSNGDMGFVSRMEKMVADTVLRQLSGKFAAGNHDVEYVYAFGICRRKSCVVFSIILLVSSAICLVDSRCSEESHALIIPTHPLRQNA